MSGYPPGVSDEFGNLVGEHFTEFADLYAMNFSDPISPQTTKVKQVAEEPIGSEGTTNKERLNAMRAQRGLGPHQPGSVGYAAQTILRQDSAPGAGAQMRAYNPSMLERATGALGSMMGDTRETHQRAKQIGDAITGAGTFFPATAPLSVLAQAERPLFDLGTSIDNRRGGPAMSSAIDSAMALLPAAARPLGRGMRPPETAPAAQPFGTPSGFAPRASGEITPGDPGRYDRFTTPFNITERPRGSATEGTYLPVVKTRDAPMNAPDTPFLGTGQPMPTSERFPNAPVDNAFLIPDGSAPISLPQLPVKPQAPVPSAQPKLKASAPTPSADLGAAGVGAERTLPRNTLPEGGKNPVVEDIVERLSSGSVRGTISNPGHSPEAPRVAPVSRPSERGLDASQQLGQLDQTLQTPPKNSRTPQPDRQARPRIEYGDEHRATLRPHIERVVGAGEAVPSLREANKVIKEAGLPRVTTQKDLKDRLSDLKSIDGLNEGLSPFHRATQLNHAMKNPGSLKLPAIAGPVAAATLPDNSFVDSSEKTSKQADPPKHHSHSQPRTKGGQFDGPPGK